MSKTLEQPAASGAAGPRFIIYAGIWFAVFNWGASFVAARFLLHPASTALVALSPSLLAALRFCLASLFFLVPLGRAIIRRQLSVRDLLLMLLLGQLAFSLYFWMQYTGMVAHIVKTPKSAQIRATLLLFNNTVLFKMDGDHAL